MATPSGIRANPPTQGWAIAVGGIGLVIVGGTRFGTLAAGFLGIALLYQVGMLLGDSLAPAKAG